MRPGEIVTCTSCGATSDDAIYTGQTWREGDPLIVTWRNGPHARHDLSSKYTAEIVNCAWCVDKARGFPALTNRPLPREAPWTAGGPVQTFEIPAVGCSPTATVVDPQPVGLLRGPPVPEAAPDVAGGPLERPSSLGKYQELATAYHAERGEHPPGRDNPGATRDEAAWGRWTEWCRARAAGQAPKAKPRGQLGLGF